MSKIIFLFSFFTFLPFYGNAQCLCADIEFEIKLNGLKFNNEIANYSIQIIKPDASLKIPDQVAIREQNIKNKKVHFSFPTNGGIKKLKFIITKKSDNNTMSITVTNMTYDNDYFIDLLKFKPGNYLFNWNEINKCQTENQSDKRIQCDGKKLYQLQLKTPKENFTHNKIRPIRIKEFAELIKDSSPPKK